VEDIKSHVCRLKKVMYRLKQAPRAWYGRKCIYVDDLFLTGEENIITDCKKKIDAEFG
jgi:hypothetical protein